jgi:hypothetical protein
MIKNFDNWYQLFLSFVWYIIFVIFTFFLKYLNFFIENSQLYAESRNFSAKSGVPSSKIIYMAILNTYHPTLLSLPNRFIFYFLISHKEFHALRVFLVSCVVCYSIRKTRFGSIFPPDPRWGLRNLIRPLGAQVRPQYCHLVLTISIFLNFSLSYTLLLSGKIFDRLMHFLFCFFNLFLKTRRQHPNITNKFNTTFNCSSK